MDPMATTDADLLRRFRETGDQGALSTLFERHRALAYRVAMGVVGNAADAEDAAQDAFLNLLAYESRVRMEESLAGLVARMALRAAQRLARSRSRRYARETAWVDRASFTTEDLASDLARREEARIMRDAVTALHERYRLPVVLHYFQGLSTRETADALGITQTAVTTRLSRAVGKLRNDFSRSGVVLTVPALVALLRHYAVTAGPAGAASVPLGGVASGAALSTPFVPGASAAVGVWAGAVKAKLVVAALLVALAGGTWALRGPGSPWAPRPPAAGRIPTALLGSPAEQTATGMVGTPVEPARSVASGAAAAADEARWLIVRSLPPLHLRLPILGGGLPSRGDPHAGASAAEQPPAALPAFPEDVPWDAEVQSGEVLALAADQRGRLWAGTAERGLFCWDPSAPEGERWRVFTTADGLGDNCVSALACDRTGRVWAGSPRHGVAVFNGEAWQTYDASAGPAGSHVFDIALSPVDGDVWLATDAGLTRYCLASDEWRHYAAAEGLPPGEITALAFDRGGTLFAGTLGEGVATARAADYARWQIAKAPETAPATPVGSGLPSGEVRDVLVTRGGAVCIATARGLAWSTNGGRSWTYLRGRDYAGRASRAGLEALLPEDDVTCLAEDTAGVLWLGFRKAGVLGIRAQTGQVVCRAMRHPGGGEDAVTAILPTRGRGPLVGSHGRGLTRLDWPLGEKPGVGPEQSPAVDSPPLPTPARPPSGETEEPPVRSVSWGL